ncbi:MAG: surface lipoprotein assembly modifier, partial [Nitrospirota bacterium]|nr:surface lipoprotein assembly modifier [Nitrospirota bacterium]
TEIMPLFENKEFKAAYKRLWEIVQEHPDNAELNFQLGMAAFEIGRYEAAAAAFERVLIANPESHRARLELGRAFFQLKSFVLAREQFEAVLAINPPKSVATAIQQYLDLIEKQMATHRFSGRLALGWQYDSNVATAPGSDQISTVIGTFTLGADSLPKVDNAVITQFFLSHFYDPGQSGGLVWQDSLSYYASRYKHMTNFNLDVITLNSGPGYTNNGYRVQLPFTFDLVQLGNEPYARNWGIAPTIGYSGIKNLDLSLTGTVQRREYNTDEERDSDYYSVDFTPRVFLLGGKMMLQGSVKFSDEKAHRKYWSNEALEGALGIMVQLPHDYVLFVQHSSKAVDYRAIQSLYANRREDREYRTLVNINKRLLKNLSLTLSYTYTRNHSNLDLYDYDKKQLTTMLAWEF